MSGSAWRQCRKVTDMLVVDCECGEEMVFDEALASRITQCPTCQRPLKIVGADVAPSVPAAQPAAPAAEGEQKAAEDLLTSTCRCGKMRVVDEPTSAKMLRCPACDRLVSRFQVFGTEHWRPAKPEDQQAPDKREPLVRTARPLVFRYSRGPAVPILMCLLMLATLVLPWRLQIRDENFLGEMPVPQDISPRTMISNFGELLSASPSWQQQPVPAVLAFAVAGWIAAAATILAILVLRGRARHMIACAAGLVALGFSAGFLSWDFATIDPASSLQIVAMFLLIPLFVVNHLRLRVGLRGGMVFLSGALGAILLVIALISLVLMVRSDFGSQTFPEAFWPKIGAILKYTFWDFILRLSVIFPVILALTGGRLLLQSLGSSRGTFSGALGATIMLFVSTTLGALNYLFSRSVELDNSNMFLAALAGDGKFSEPTCTAINLTLLVGGAAVLVISGLTNALAIGLAKPDDWQHE